MNYGEKLGGAGRRLESVVRRERGLGGSTKLREV